MPGNIVLGSSGEIDYNVVQPTSYGSGVDMYYGSFLEIYPNQYYKFSVLEIISVTLMERNTQLYQEYMFEFTAGTDDTSFILKANFDLYWVRPIEIKAGYRYQISVVNQIVLWTGGGCGVSFRRRLLMEETAAAVEAENEEQEVQEDDTPEEPQSQNQ